MPRKAMQVYLTPEQHSALRDAASRYGRSMTALVRDLVQTQFVERLAPPTDLSDLAGLVLAGSPTDVARERDELLAEAVSDLHRH